MKAGRFHDFWRGNGWFVSFDVRGGWLLFAFRPKCWRLRIVHPHAKPDVTRLYFGPFEVERTHRPAAQGAGDL
ncbi:hypothetical protein [Massilia alkalitolerans]|uniref:hypothetical protein n=1 Tax=Massilia alkalitolerans TaxID=286638 RepID=UPI0012EB6011|nr:hypothetical protein [Massilia alkalitolerans]